MDGSLTSKIPDAARRSGRTSTFMSANSGQIRILTVKPGFVDTPMTRHLKKNALFARPEDVGLEIARAIRQSKQILYVPRFWRWIMMVIRGLPRALIRKL